MRFFESTTARYRLVTVAIALSGTLACASLTWLQWDIIHMQRELDINNEIRDRWEAVRVEIKRAEDLQDTVVAFFEATENVGREQFDAFAASLPSVQFQAISFAAYVPIAKRAEFERTTGAAHELGTRIWELDAEERPIPAAERDAYFPVTYIFPAAGNLSAVGFDLLSEARRRSALMDAIETGKTVRTEPIRLVQEPARWGFLVYKPVYARHKRGMAVNGDRSQLIGMVSAVYKFGSLVQAAGIGRETREQEIALYDGSEPSFPVFVQYAHATTRDRRDLERPIAVVASLPGARSMTARAMQRELSAVFLTADTGVRWWKEIDATILGTLVIGLLLTAALVANHVRVYRLAIRLRQATEEARLRKEEAEAASVAKSSVLAYASHDLRQPLHALELFVAHLKEQPLEYGAAKIVSNVDDCVHALGELLNALLDLSRLESGSIEPMLQAAPVSDLWKQLHGEFAKTAAEKGLDLRFRPSALWLMTDWQLLHRILLNLVSNAIRYTRTGGVLVACRRAGDHARLEVWDTGVGIAPEDREDVFREFVQLDNPEGNRTKGLGLGLTIVDRTARLLNHRLSMRSVPGRGSCFRLEVPIAGAAVRSGVASAEASGSSDSRSFAGFTVLVVEDDVLARHALVNLLRSWRCAVIEAGTAEHAQEALMGGCRPDLIVSDFQLPNRRSGIDLIKKARSSLGYPVAAFLISGDTSPEVIAAAATAGLMLLHKPVKAPRLRSMLNLLLTSGRETQP